MVVLQFDTISTHLGRQSQRVMIEVRLVYRGVSSLEQGVGGSSMSSSIPSGSLNSVGANGQELSQQ